MSTLPSILLVQDDDFAAELIAEIVSGHYLLNRCFNAAEASEYLEDTHLSLVLLDIGLPDGAAFNLCQFIRKQDVNSDLPVIFLASSNDEADRLTAYDVGGDDYIRKPIVGSELLYRIARTMKLRQERNNLKIELKNAFSVAMTAMSSAAEVGMILQFLRNSFQCQNYLHLSSEVLNVTTSYGLEASVQIRGQQPSISYGTYGLCSALEESILSTMATHGRLESFSKRTACSYEHITIIIKNMPVDDPDRNGRMSDNLALLAEAVNARVTALDNELAILKQRNDYSDFVKSIKESLIEIADWQNQITSFSPEDSNCQIQTDQCPRADKDQSIKAKIASLLEIINANA